MDALPVISKKANELFRESFTECCRVRDEIPSADKTIENDSKRITIAKKNLMDSAQLAGQIINALDGGSLLLALIGLRSLTESLINTKYTFTHPDHKTDLTWVRTVCKDYFDRGNDPKAMKSELNDEYIIDRAKETGADDLFTKTFVGLCNYTHMLVHTGPLNDPVKFEDYTRNGYVSALSLLHDIREHIREHFSLKGWPKHEERIVEFRDNYFSPE